MKPVPIQSNQTFNQTVNNRQTASINTNFSDLCNLHFKEPNQGPRTFIKINGENKLTLVDCGAATSLISPTLAASFPKFQNQQLVLRSIKNDIFQDSGIAVVTFQISDQTFTFPMMIVNLANNDVVLGDDFLQTFNVNVDRDNNKLFSQKYNWSVDLTPKDLLWNRLGMSSHITTCKTNTNISFTDNKIPHSENEVQKPQQIPTWYLRISHKVEIPPRSQIQVPICSVGLESNDIAVISPSNHLLKTNGILTPHMMITKDTKSVVITNCTNERKFLCSRTRLGKLTNLVNENDIVPVESSNVHSSSADSNPVRPVHDAMKVIKKNIKLGPDVSDGAKGKLNAMLEKYQDCFSTDPNKLNQIKDYKFHIETGDAKPIRRKPFNLSDSEHDCINDNVRELLNKKLIEPSNSPWCFSPFLVPNRDENGRIKYRMVIDYRKLNDVTRPLAYPLPRIDQIIQKLRGAKFISTLDMASGYHQIALDESSKEKTAFQTRDNFYQWNVMPFGPTCAPAVFSQLVHLIMAGIIDDHLAVYLDDICIFTVDEETHLKKLDQVFTKLKSAGLQLKPSKCKFMFSEIRVLGYKATRTGILPTDEHISGLSRMRPPRTRKELQKILGFFGFFRRFIKNYASIIRPLQHLLQKTRKFLWEEKHENIFEKLKKLLTTAPVLAHLHRDGEVILRTDGSLEGIGASISQIQNGVERPICFISRCLNNAEKNYTTTMIETLAVVWSLQKLRPLVFQRKIKCFTDHSALCYLVKGPKHTLPSKLTRMLLCLSEFNIDFYHVRGSANHVGDTLSRFPVEDAPEENPNVVDLPILSLNTESIVEMQENDSELQLIRQQCLQNKLKGKLKHAYLHNNIIMYQSPSHNNPVILLPKKLRKSVLTEFHDDPISAHLGFFKTFQKINSRFYWPKMRAEVKEYVRTCELCQKRKLPKQKPAGLLQPIPIPESPFSTIGCDLVGPINRSKTGKRFIITVTDLTTRYLECSALRDGKADEISKFLVERIFLRHGVPHHIITDLGCAFTGELMQELNKFMGITHNRTTSFHPQSNGACERPHSTIMDAISFYVSQGKDDWDAFIPHIQFAINSAVHEGHLFSPHYLVYGQEPTLPAEVELGLPRYCNVSDIADKVKLAREIAVQRLKGRQVSNAKYANKKRRHVMYNIGDQVLVRKFVNVKGKSKKLFMNWIGPYTIIAKSPHNDVNYVVEAMYKKKLIRQTVHVEKLKLYHERNNMNDDCNLNNELNMNVENEKIDDNDNFSDKSSLVQKEHVRPFPSTQTSPRYNMRSRKPVQYSK